MTTVTAKVRALLNTAASSSGSTPHEAHTAASIAVDIARKADAGHLVARALNAQAKAAARVARTEVSDATEPNFINPLHTIWEKAHTKGQFIFDYTARDKAVKHYAWSVPTEYAIRRIIECGPVGDVIAFDQYQPHENKDYPFEQGWFEVQEGGPEKGAEHSNRALFLCWPPYATSFAYDCLKAYQGDTLIFVGEGSGGCTGDDDFFRLLDDHYDQDDDDFFRLLGDHYDQDDDESDIKAQWEEVECVTIPQWEGIHDYMTIYRRKK